MEQDLVLLLLLLAIMKVLPTIMETLSIPMMDAILVLALMDKSIVPKTLVNLLPVITKDKHTMKETLSIAKMDVIHVLDLLEMSLVRKTHVDAIMKVIHTVKETLSLV